MAERKISSNSAGNKKSAKKPVSKGTAPFSPFTAEAALARMTGEMPFTVEKIRPVSNLQQTAQNLFYQAMETNSMAERLLLLRKALDADPENVDAHTTLLRNSFLPPLELIGELKRIVDMAKEQLGAKVFKEFAGHFWGFHETRPYMRARMQLAEAYRSAGMTTEAIKEYEGLLKLNPNDNQGVRFELITAYLSLNQPKDVGKLFKQYKDDCDFSVTFSWGRVLERLLIEGEPGAVHALAAARKQNPHMESYLKGHRRLPKNLPYSYEMGSKEEALCFAQQLLAAWGPHPHAQAWLLKQSANV